MNYFFSFNHNPQRVKSF